MTLGYGLLPTNLVPEIGECRDGALIGHALVQDVFDAPDPGFFSQPTKFVRAIGFDGAAGGILTVRAFNQAYPWLRGMRAQATGAP